MKLPALEKNILKYRAIEMTLILFYAEDFKRLIIDSLDITESISGKERFKKTDKNPLKKALNIFVQDNILTETEINEITKLIDYRNDIAHRLEQLTKDVIHPKKQQYYNLCIQPKYNYDISQKFQFYRKKILQNFQDKGYITLLSLNKNHFENAELTYKEELERLHKRIINQMEKRIEKYAIQSQKDL